ncbi:probable E3 ubiquitin-protein ligase RHY1A isoform X2 [Hordeum vulgare subsp. vulgare]|uniref:probable E3 ubiquitin-protein ligase RHY1A isoform X2 n=1 Tax=Hordeum vulgare subsp. vulgare TaxID=112509 RepID=UPI000296FBFB|nr:probable E3 ubiquitin-protein ligase RHY1A isoform X2 [Hordeum vulgare subsp. vulgare]
MGFMAGMLPGVEFARRRRLRPAAEAPCAGPRRPSSLGTFGHDHAHLGSAGFAKRSGACEEAWTTQLDSIAREAKERLDQKLRSQRESMAKRRHSTGSLRLPAPSSTDGDHPANDTAGAASGLQRELFTKKGGGRRFSWGRRKEQEQQQQAECAVCLEEFRAGDVLAHLPCAHRFHWACAVPWVQAAARCPFCRAAVPLADHQHV